MTCKMTTPHLVGRYRGRRVFVLDVHNPPIERRRSGDGPPFADPEPPRQIVKFVFRPGGPVQVAEDEVVVEWPAGVEDGNP